MTIKHVIWDCDGVLVDSEKLAMRVAAEIVDEALKNSGKPGVDIDQFVVDYAGKHFSHMLADVGLDDPEGNLDRIKMQRTIEVLTNDVETFAGLRESMQALKDRGVVQAVATSSELLRVLPCLDKHSLTDFFRGPDGTLHVYSAMDSLSPPVLKPEPDIYLYAMKRIGACPENAIAVEDSASGATAAVRAGLRVLGFIGAGHIPAGQKEAHGRKLQAIGVARVFDAYHGFSDCVAALPGLIAGVPADPSAASQHSRPSAP